MERSEDWKVTQMKQLLKEDELRLAYVGKKLKEFARDCEEGRAQPSITMMRGYCVEVAMIAGRIQKLENQMVAANMIKDEVLKKELIRASIANYPKPGDGQESDYSSECSSLSSFDPDLDQE